ncbi:MAG: transcription-repair coupling factor [Lentisphaerae bacterium]|nr:transcription-repair coupling factor [Lentisphaerota bacterium]
MSSPIINKIQKKLFSRQLEMCVGNVDESVAAAVLLGKTAHAIEQGRMVFIVLPRLDNAEEFLRQLKLWQKAFDLPWRTEMLNETLRGRFYIAGAEAERARVLTKIAHREVDAVVASLAALLAPAPEPSALRKSEILLKTGDTCSFKGLLEQLVELDYDDEYEVANPGEFARRGGIIDVFSPDAAYPARIEFFGDEIDSIRLFDPATQRSLMEKVDSYRIINRCTVQSLTSEDGGMYENTVPALEYIDCGSMDVFELYSSNFKEYFTKFAAEGDEKLYHEFIGRIKKENHLRLFSSSEPAPENTVPCGIYPATAHLVNDLPDAAADRGRELLLRQWVLQLKQWQEFKYQIIIAGSDPDAPARLEAYLAENSLQEIKAELVELDAPGGFLDYDSRMVLITENELLAGVQAGKKQLKTAANTSASEQEVKLENAVLADLEVASHAVHTAHGIGIYKGSRIEESPDGFAREVLILEYADNAILQVPVYQVNSVSRYIAGGRGSNVKLHRLGGAKWAKDKTATTEAVHQYAAEMLRLQAVRSAAPALAIPPNELGVKEFAARFKFTETPDQLRSIDEIEQDLASGKPMDRLLCGDVGYGKTEIAMRAAFRMVDAGYQVAMIVPTTVLAQQHYLSFIERFAGYPYTIEVLSRFRSVAEQQAVVSRLASGGVDIVIGTHRLASADIAFKNLGLVIVDEEQRFGVKVKDRLLRLRTDVNVLTMSATPIPRTLYLSMAGARQLSTIMTAPVERLPVKTIVMRENDAEIARAVMDEIARGGQVYILHNRVKTINDRLKKLSALLPGVSIGIAHGQMAEDELENVMHDFVENRLQVLLCTTIIESGLDMPNANTIIIERADRFGLAELYQLRGRVGRWKHQAYAYMVIPDSCYITSDGRKRIAAIRRCNQLGAGMKLALRDLEIRGAGNLLGSEQSGHITAVGFELYCQLLQQEIALLKGGNIREWLPDVDVNIEFIRYGIRGTAGVLAAGIPVEYIESEQTRFAVYRTLARFTRDEDIIKYDLELIDRFGKMPPETGNLLTLALIKLYAAKAGFTSITVAENRVLLRKRSSDTYRIDGKIPRLDGSRKPEIRLQELLRIVKLAAMENAANNKGL